MNAVCLFLLYVNIVREVLSSRNGVTYVELYSVCAYTFVGC